MNRKWTIFPAAAGLALAGAVSIFLARSRPAPSEPPPAVSIQPAGPGQTVAITLSPEEIFRRAFWRRPTAADRIVHADRREWSDRAQHVQRWQWFLQLEPGADLLHALRDPSTFGLIRSAGSAATVPAAIAGAPGWFPAPAQLTGCEILRAPAGGLTLYYRAQDNVLFATDAGRGFAPPIAAPLASR